MVHDSFARTTWYTVILGTCHFQTNLSYPIILLIILISHKISSPYHWKYLIFSLDPIFLYEIFHCIPIIPWFFHDFSRISHLTSLLEVNPKGGAIALGHPLGATGARQIATLLPELKRQGKKYLGWLGRLGVGQKLMGISFRTKNSRWWIVFFLGWFWSDLAFKWVRGLLDVFLWDGGNRWSISLMYTRKLDLRNASFHMVLLIFGCHHVSLVMGAFFTPCGQMNSMV